MTALIILMAASAVGVEAGWEPLSEGGHEYTIQIEPSLISVLQNGSDIVSEVPAQVDVRRFRIKLGTGSLSRIDGPPRSEPTESLAAPSPPARDVAAADELAPAWPATQPFEQGDEPPAVEAAPPDDSLALPSFEPAPADESFGQEHAETQPSNAETEPTVPAKFEQPAEDAQPLAGDASSATDVPQSHDARKPRLDAVAGEPERPWMLLLVVVVFLACSLGANVYLGWLAWEARHRLRDSLARFRTAAPA